MRNPGRALALLAVWTVSCDTLENLPERLFDRRTAREKYEAGLEAAGLGASALVRDWRSAGSRALEAAPRVNLPIEEQGYFAPAEPAAVSWRVAVKRGQRLSLVEEMEIAARAGYTGVEPWIEEIDRYVRGGGSLKELGQRIRDLGLTVESAIGFPESSVSKSKTPRFEITRRISWCSTAVGPAAAARS